MTDSIRPASNYSRCTRIVAAVTLALLCASCATTRLPPISSQGGSFAPLDDELALWYEAREEERKLLEEVVLYDDPLLERYLEDLVDDLTPSGMAANSEVEYRVRVIEDPTLNAFAYPHGSLYVHTGLLARIENESQLATILGHEMSHVELRHMVRHERSVRNKRIGFAAASIAAALILAHEEADAWWDGDYHDAVRVGILADLLVGLGLHFAFIASVNGYGRGLEIEADHSAFAKLRDAGFDPHEAPRVYEILQEERGESRDAEVFFFGSHPRLKQRTKNARAWLAANPTTPPVEASDRSRFDHRIRPVIRDDARLNLEAGRLHLAQQQLALALSMMPDDPETHYLFARLLTAEAEHANDPEDRVGLMEEARAALFETLRLEPDHTAAHLEIARIAYEQERWEEACAGFRRFCELQPDSEERDRVLGDLLELEAEGACTQIAEKSP